MRVLLVIGVVACGRTEPPAPAPAVVAPAVAVAPVVVDAAPAPDAAPPEPATVTLTYASLDELLGATGRAPPDQLGGFQLGGPAAEMPHQLVITGWGTGTASARAVDGKVRHVVMELERAAGEGDATDTGVLAGELGALVTRLSKPWGPPTRGIRTRWRGPQAQLSMVLYDGFLRGTPSIVVDLLPPGETHVCGTEDGFAPFFRTFRAAIAAKDAAAFTAMREPVASDRLTCDDDLACIKGLLAKLPRTPECHQSREVYYWTAREQNHGGTYFEFVRGPAGWRARGPMFIGHDDDPNVTAP